MAFSANQSGREEPLWMTAQRDGECSKCAGDIIQGEPTVYDPQSFKFYCSACGTDELGEDPGMDKPGPCMDCFC